MRTIHEARGVASFANFDGAILGIGAFATEILKLAIQSFELPFLLPIDIELLHLRAN